MKRIEAQLKFSNDANENIKSDYDLLQEKFDKHLKATNNLLLDQKDELEELTNRCVKLQIFQDDHQDSLEAEKDKLKKEFEPIIKEKDKMLREFSDENMKYQNEIEELKEDLKKRT